jgi:hypothetical protein
MQLGKGIKARWLHVKSIGRPWWLLVVGAWGAFWSADAVIAKYGSQHAKDVWDKYTLHFPFDWKIGVMGLLAILVLLLIEGSFRHHCKIVAEHDASKQRLDDVLEGVPKLVCKGVSWDDTAIVGNEMELQGSPPTPILRKTIIGVPTFYHLRIANEPTGLINRKVAEKVAARVQLFHENGTPAANERLHRWKDSPGPAEAGKMADRLLPVDIPPSGVEYELDIAMKYDDDDAFYTPNNETVMRRSLGWREKDFEFPIGIYIAEIHFRGPNVVSNLKCQMVNKGKGTKLEITPL